MSLDPKTVGELTELLLSLIDFTKETNRKKLLQFVRGLLNSNTENLKLVLKISYQIWTGNQGTRHFANDEKSLLYQIWRVYSNSTETDQSRHGHIIVKILEEFLNDQKDITVFSSCLYECILQQLESACSEDRRNGRFLLTKLTEGCVNDSRNDEDFNDLHFLSYITIIQCLEVEGLCKDKQGLIWMRTLYMRLLEVDNILVLRWTLEYLMDHLTMADLERANLLMEFLTATNRMELHDVRSYYLREKHMIKFISVMERHYYLPDKQMKKFISGMEMNQFLMVFVQIPWCDVPLVRWLYSMESNETQINHKLLLQISTLVQKIECTQPRIFASKRIFNFFKYTIDKMSLIEYIELIDTISRFNEVQYTDFYKLCKMICDCENIDDQIVHFKPRIFDLMCNPQKNVFYPDIVYEALLTIFRKVPKSRLGLWRLSILFILRNYTEVQNFFHTEYNVNTKLLRESTNLKELQEHLLDKLNCNAEEEKQFVLKQSVNLFVRTNIKSWTQLEEFNLNPVELLKNATYSTFSHLMNILRNHKGKLQDEKVTDTILEVWKQNLCYEMFDTTRNILSYAANNLNADEMEKLVEQMILKCYNDCKSIEIVLYNATRVPKTLLIRELIYKENTTARNCIEYALLASLGFLNVRRRDEFSSYLCLISNDDRIEIFEQLLRINENIVKDAPRVENSKEIQIQMRIVRTLMPYKLENWSNDLWQALLAPSNQLIISYLYECLLAKHLCYNPLAFELIVDKLRSLSSLESNQQDSIISAVYFYYMTNSEKLKWENFLEVIQLLSQQIVHSSTETQLFIQLVLHKLAVKCEQMSLLLPEETCTQISPNFSFEDKDSQYLIEARLILPEIIRSSYFDGIVSYITNGPFDELDWDDFDLKFLWSFESWPLFKKIRNAFSSRYYENDNKTSRKPKDDKKTVNFSIKFLICILYNHKTMNNNE